MLLPVRTEFSGVNGEREKNIFPDQVTTRRQNWQPTIYYLVDPSSVPLLKVMTDRTLLYHAAEEILWVKFCFIIFRINY